MKPNQSGEVCKKQSKFWRLAASFALAGACTSEAGYDLSEDDPTGSSGLPLICGESDFAQTQCSVKTWPNGVIPYRFDAAPIQSCTGGTCTTRCPGGTWSETDKTHVRNYMAKWTTGTNNLITFVESTDTTAVKIHRSNGGGFFSLGYSPGADGCANPDSDWNTLHELGHLIGLQHTMVRNDRDRYIAVNTAVTCPPANPDGYWNIDVRCGQDRIMPITTGSSELVGDRADYGPFNVASLMQYGTACNAGTCDSSFAGCTSGICDVIMRGGGKVVGGSSPFSVTALEGSAVIEMYAENGTWQRFRPSPTLDPSPTSPYSFDLANNVMIDGSPAIVRWDETTWAVARGGSRLYIKKDVEKMGPWTLHSTLDNVSSDPAISRRPGTALDLAVIRNGQVYYEVSVDAVNWVPTNLGAPTTGTLSAPAVAGCSTTAVSVFVIQNSKLYERRFDGSNWGSWTQRSSANTILRGKPAAVSWGSQRLDVVAVNQPLSSLDHWWSGDCGSSWSQDNIGGSVGGLTSPAIAARGSGNLNVFIVGTTGVLAEKAYTGTWGNWTSIGGYLGLVNSPAAAGGVENSTLGTWLAANLQEVTPVGTTRHGLWTRVSATCPAASSNGGTTFCSSLCPCNEGQGDCDDETNGTDCVGSLVCGHNLGTRYGMSSSTDVCVDLGCLAPGGTSTCHATCPCGLGGTCVNDEDCLPRLQCSSSGQCVAL